MDNVVAFARPVQPARECCHYTSLIASFAYHRRQTEDVFWLKENAEILSVLLNIGAQVPPAALEPYRRFYDTAADRLTFFPQYYRFILGIVLDLEDLGMHGDMGRRLCQMADDKDLIDSELSDLQRGEAMRLLARRGIAAPGAAQIARRLLRFSARSETFAIPNRKACYELTHIIFYLTEYGTAPMDMCKSIEKSLHYAGLLAALEQNYDLLSEVCIAMRFAGLTPPVQWDDIVASDLNGYHFYPSQDGAGDNYHAYLMAEWSAARAGQGAFERSFSDQGMAFVSTANPVGALRGLSIVLYNLKESRAGLWSEMSHRVLSLMERKAAAHARRISETSQHFGAFFEIFARTLRAAERRQPPARRAANQGARPA